MVTNLKVYNRRDLRMYCKSVEQSILNRIEMKMCFLMENWEDMCLCSEEWILELVEVCPELDPNSFNLRWFERGNGLSRTTTVKLYIDLDESYSEDDCAVFTYTWFNKTYKICFENNY